MYLSTRPNLLICATNEKVDDLISCNYAIVNNPVDPAHGIKNIFHVGTYTDLKYNKINLM